MLKLLLFGVILLSSSAYASDLFTCGGNCPDASCLSCPCGRLPKKISIEDYCKGYDGWNVNCCKCIIEHTSKGNAHFSRDYNDGSFYG